MGKTGHLTFEEIHNITNNKHFDSFVETGTYLGQSTLEAAKIFKNVYTIEIVPSLYEQAKINCDNYKHKIFFHLGDTIEILPVIAQTVALNKHNTLWFLDAHQSGPDTGNNGKHVPLLEELNIILDNINLDVENIFVIDDVRLFSKFWDWADISTTSIKKCFESHNIVTKSELIRNDRLIIYI